ncbi:MAG: glycoside hydrolase family protein [Rikenellaceae bacterium]
MKRIFILSLLALASAFSVEAPARELVRGAAFMDLIEPISPLGQLSSDLWGAAAVVPRYPDIGLEDNTYSYWGGNIVKGDDGKYHMFVARWREDISRPNGKSGHELWWASEVAHAVSDDPMGRYEVIDVIGAGHNPEVYRLNDGTYVLGVMGDKAYVASTINGPWRRITTSFNESRKMNHTNRTYVVRKDGSVLMMNKEGYTYTCPADEIERFTLVDVEPAYRRRNGSHEEDPVIWRDEVCYNLIVNECLGRKAYHLTSPDGYHWSYEDGLAYTPEIAIRKDGTREDWHKFERPKILTDEYGRATHINFAAADTLKHCDVALDNHSSKNMVFKLKVPFRVELIELSGDNVKVKILAEEGFNPQKDIKIKTMRFGASSKVNYGGGMRVVNSTPDGADLIVVFGREEHGLIEEDYKAKILGEGKGGDFVIGYVKLK